METKALLLTGLIIAASGCSYLPGESEETVSGLDIVEFNAVDSELAPDQSTVIRARIKNAHAEVDVESLEIYNEGPYLDVGERECTPEPSELKGATSNYQPEMVCRWTLEAPGEEALQGFNSRTETLKLRLGYETETSLRRPLKVSFRPEADYSESSPVSSSASSSEVSLSARTESPILLSSDRQLVYTAENVGPGRVEGDYSFEFQPSGIFEGCTESGKPVTGSSFTSRCGLEASSPGTRNVFLSVHYKYVKEPNLDVRVVDRA